LQQLHFPSPIVPNRLIKKETQFYLKSPNPSDSSKPASGIHSGTQHL
jgi:hypothetical protein